MYSSFFSIWIGDTGCLLDISLKTFFWYKLFSFTSSCTSFISSFTTGIFSSSLLEADSSSGTSLVSTGTSNCWCFKILLFISLLSSTFSCSSFSIFTNFLFLFINIIYITTKKIKRNIIIQKKNKLSLDKLL